MSSYTLTKAACLGGANVTIGQTRLEEVESLSIASLAIPRGEESKFAKALKSAYGTELPEPGSSSLSKDGTFRFLSMSPDQLFVLFEHDGDDADLLVAKAMGDKAYVTLQSDNWVSLRISGERAISALQRVCQIDLDENVFPEGSVARTVLEYMGVTVIREDKNTFLLISAWSSAQSFYHALEQSVINVN